MTQDKILGAVLGAAIGDAMGAPVEFMTMEQIEQTYGPAGVQGFDPTEHPARYTDDTQMAEVVLRGLLAGDDLEGTMERIALGFIVWADHPQGGHRAPGSACLDGCRALAGGTHWSKVGGLTAGGCGSVMRCYPFGLMFARDLEQARTWAAEHSKLTHRHPIAIAACAAMAVGVGLLMRGAPLPDVLAAMEEAATPYDKGTAQLIGLAVDRALQDAPPRLVLERLQGWAAHEAIAAATFVFARHADDPRAAILEAANTPGDSDSIATLVGALVGCRCGASALPAEWVEDVERSTDLTDLANKVKVR